nr:hypothetical protein [uncultured bacterium]
MVRNHRWRCHRLHSFYSELFGWKIDANNEMQYGLAAAEDAGIGGGIGPDAEGGPGYVTFYIDVDDINAYTVKVEQLGGKIIMPPTELSDFNMTFAQFADPEGHVIGLTQSTRQ